MEARQQQSSNKTNQELDMHEYCYEGEFLEGYKHGIGRFYFPDGSYFY